MNTQICPRCGRTYTGYPAVSRHGLGDICSRCGHVEAFEAMGMDAEKVEQLGSVIKKIMRCPEPVNARMVAEWAGISVPESIARPHVKEGQERKGAR